MERLDVIFKWFIAAGAAAAAYLFGGWDQSMAILLFFVVADYITGFIAGAVEGKLNSEIGYKGIFKKVLIFAVVAIAHQIDVFSANESKMIMSATVAFYVWNELLSIIENIGRTGLPLPDILIRAVEVLKGKGGGK